MSGYARVQNPTPMNRRNFKLEQVADDRYWWECRHLRHGDGKRGRVGALHIATFFIKVGNVNLSNKVLIVDVLKFGRKDRDS